MSVEQSGSPDIFGGVGWVANYPVNPADAMGGDPASNRVVIKDFGPSLDTKAEGQPPSDQLTQKKQGEE